MNEDTLWDRIIDLEKQVENKNAQIRNLRKENERLKSERPTVDQALEAIEQKQTNLLLACANYSIEPASDHFEDLANALEQYNAAIETYKHTFQELGQREIP